MTGRSGVVVESVDRDAVDVRPLHRLGLVQTWRKLEHRVQAGGKSDEATCSVPAGTPPRRTDGGAARRPAAIAGRVGRNAPDAMKSARVSWSITDACPVISSRAATSGSKSRSGSTSQPRRRPGRQSLARGAGVDDVLGRESLHRTDCPTVVAELGVVVVLDDHSGRVPGPSHETRYDVPG